MSHNEKKLGNVSTHYLSWCFKIWRVNFCQVVLLKISKCSAKFSFHPLGALRKQLALLTQSGFYSGVSHVVYIEELMLWVGVNAKISYDARSLGRLRDKLIWAEFWSESDSWKSRRSKKKNSRWVVVSGGLWLIQGTWLMDGGKLASKNPQRLIVRVQFDRQCINGGRCCSLSWRLY